MALFFTFRDCLVADSRRIPSKKMTSRLETVPEIVPTSMRRTSFHEWIRRVEEIPDAIHLTLAIAQFGVADVSRDSLRKVVRLSPRDTGGPAEGSGGGGAGDGRAGERAEGVSGGSLRRAEAPTPQGRAG